MNDVVKLLKYLFVVIMTGVVLLFLFTALRDDAVIVDETQLERPDKQTIPMNKWIPEEFKDKG